MLSLGLLSLAALSVVAVAAAIHLVLLWRRTRKLPELFLAISIFFSVVGNGIVVALGADVTDATYPVASIQLGAMILNVGFTFAVIFNAYVYRRDATWAWSLATILSAGLFAAQGWAWALGIENDDHAPLFWTKFALRAICYGWGAVEALLYYRLMRRRVRHGLGEPVVANRFLLWGVASILAIVTLAGFQMVRWFGFESPLGAASLIVGSFAGAPSAALFWLTFFPPRRYRQLLERDSARLDGGR